MISKIRRKIGSIYRALSWRRHNARYQKHLSSIGMVANLRSGIQVQVHSLADWTLFVEIFSDGEYDLPILETLSEQTSESAISMLDLGSNVGIFIARALDLARKTRPAAEIRILGVEGEPSTFASLQRGLSTRLPNEQITVLNGLAGERSGGAVMAANPFHAMTRIARSAKEKGAYVKYIDLEEQLASWSEIDLLKCDIEGAEEAFILNYPGLLLKTKRAVIEFHHDHVSYARCVEALSKAGLHFHSRLSEHSQVAVEYFTRKKP